MGDIFLRGQSGGGSDVESIESAVVTLVSSSFTYDGNEKTQGVASVVLDGEALTEGTDYVVIGNKATDAGTHTLTVVGIMAYGGTVSASWSIAKASLTKPAISSGSFTYAPNTPRTPILDANYDSTTMSLSGDTSATNAGSYTLTVSLRDADNYKWSDNTTAPFTLSWSIAKKPLTKPAISSGSFTYAPNTTRTPTTNSAYDANTMSKSGDTSATNAGNYTLVVSLQDTDNYEWADHTTAALNLSWSIAKAQGTISVSPTSLEIQGVNATGTSTITRTGDGSLSVQSSSTSIATVTRSGTTVTVTGKAGGTATITVTMAEGDNYLGASAQIAVTVVTTRVYGVSWDGTSTTAWTRTDDAAGFTDPVPYVSGATSYSSPFDNRLPWSGMTVVDDSEAGKMVAIPKFWYKITQNGSGMKIQIADGAKDGFSVSPAHMDRGDGKGERDVVYIGRYHCASDYKSKTGVKPVASKTRSSFRSSIHGLGSTIWQADWAMRFTLFLLYLVEFANWNTQDKIGRGCGNNSATQNMGYTDSMPYHTGTTQSNRTTYGLGTQYRNIEGLWDNVYDWIDGCYNSSSGLMLILNPSNFGDSANGTSVGTPSSGYPSAFSVKNVNGTFPLFIPSAASGSDSTYSCDYWYFSASNPCVCAGGYYNQGLYRGLFCWSCVSASSSDDYVGSRSMKLP